MSTESLIEAILFYRASPMRVGEIARMLGKKAEEIENALGALGDRLAGRGVRLVTAGDTVALATAPEASKYIEGLRKEELSGELGKAALETLTLVLYRAPISKSEIDYIRGVDSSFSLRSLLVRGLIARKKNGKGIRGFVYAPTIDTLSHIGVSRTEELPEFEIVREEIEKFRREFSSSGEEPENKNESTE
ncbi:MAG: SMC-Scp complex subunit ScpB [Parcubacteria group bacterium]|nr:SMC-Scp complex subunit ScpB [Parcubacteria group bacterium]